MARRVMTSIMADDGTDAKAHSELLSRISDLRSAVETPLETVLRIYAQVFIPLAPVSKCRILISEQPMQNTALRVAVEMGILSLDTWDTEPFEDVGEDLLSQAIGRNRRNQPGLTLAQLAENASYTGKSTGDTDLLARIMRVLTAMGVCTEVSYQRYSTNAVTEALSTPGLQAGVKFLYARSPPTAKQEVPNHFKLQI